MSTDTNHLVRLQNTAHSVCVFAILPSVRSVDCLLSGVAEGAHAAAEDSVEDVGSCESTGEELSHDYHMTEAMQKVPL